MKRKSQNSTSTDQIIDQLAGKVTPVRPARLGALATLLWILAIVAMVGALAAVPGHLRADIAAGAMPTRITVGMLGALLTVVGAGIGFVRLLVPGRRLPPISGAIVGLGLLLISGSVVEAGLTHDEWHDMAGLALDGLHCTGFQSLYAAVFAVPLILGARRYAPTRLVSLGLLIGVMAVAAGFAGLLVHCPSDDVVHLALYHLVPAIGLSVGASSFVASRLRW